MEAAPDPAHRALYQQLYGSAPSGAGSGLPPASGMVGPPAGAPPTIELSGAVRGRFLLHIWASAAFRMLLWAATVIALGGAASMADDPAGSDGLQAALIGLVIAAVLLGAPLSLLLIYLSVRASLHLRRSFVISDGRLTETEHDAYRLGRPFGVLGGLFALSVLGTRQLAIEVTQPVRVRLGISRRGAQKAHRQPIYLPQGRRNPRVVLCGDRDLIVSRPYLGDIAYKRGR